MTVPGGFYGRDYDDDRVLTVVPGDPYADIPPPTEPPNTPGGGEDWATRFAPGGEWVLDAPTDVPAVWGHGDAVLWADGEALMICAGNGAGKTTLALQLVRARLGLDTRVLGLPVTPGARRVLYLAMDRPAQIRRAMARVFTDADRPALADLVVWQGPPPADLATSPGLLARMCAAADADTVVVDSLKDAAVGLTSDEVAAGYNRARQVALTAGVDVLELHHTRKRTGETSSTGIDGVYGSRWLTAGAGSVIGLDGDPGDLVVQFRHLKQPLDVVGPWDVVHDHDTGRSSVRGEVDAFGWLHQRGRDGGTARELACARADTDKPTPSDLQRARRMLNKLAEAGHARVVPGNPAAGAASRYVATGVA